MSHPVSKDHNFVADGHMFPWNLTLKTPCLERLFIENYVVVQLFCNTSFKDHLDYIRPLINNFVGVEIM